MKKLCTSRNLRCRFTRSRYLLSWKITRINPKVI